MPKVLVADDDPRIRLLVRYVLAAERTWEVLEAANGAAALRLARMARPAVVLLDVMMPNLSGYEVCRALKADPRTRGIKVAIVTGEPNAEPQALAAGADRFLAKPLRPALLLHAVRELFSSGAPTDCGVA